MRGSPSGAKEKVSTREVSLVLPPLAGLHRRLDLVSQGLRPGLSSVARQPGSPHHPAAAASFDKHVMRQRQDSRFYVGDARKESADPVGGSICATRGLVGDSTIWRMLPYHPSTQYRDAPASKASKDDAPPAAGSALRPLLLEWNGARQLSFTGRQCAWRIFRQNIVLRSL